MRSRLGPVWTELRRRHVVRVVLAYLVLAAAIGGAASDFLPGLGAPAWTLSTVLAVLVVGVPVAAVLAWVYELTPEGIQATAPRQGPVTLDPSVAVMAFSNMSPDPDQEYFADGLSEELINALAQVPGLRVVGRTSAFAFKGRNEDLRTVGRQLRVATVLEGSIRRSNDRLRITAQLIDAQTGYHIYSESFDRPLGDVFEVQDEIASTVVQRIVDKLPGHTGETDRKPRPHSRSPHAYEAYLRGMSFYWQYSIEGCRRALVSFQQALTYDPSYALAHAGASLCHTWLAGFGRESTAVQAKTSARRAVDLQPKLPEGFVSLAEALYYLDWDVEGAKRELEEAIRLSPSNVHAHGMYGNCLRRQGALAEAVREFETAVELDPLSIPMHSELANLYAAAGRPADAEAQIERTLGFDSEFAPALETLGWLRVRAGRLEDALKIFETLPPGRSSTMAALGFTLATLGREAEARDLLAQLVEASQSCSVGDHIHIARVYAALHDYDAATEHIDIAVKRKAIPAIHLSTSVRDWGQFRHHEDFQRLADQVREFSVRTSG